MKLSERIDHEADYIEATPLDTRAKRNVTIKRLREYADEVAQLETLPRSNPQSKRSSVMKHIAGWFRRNNLIMLQAQNLAKQLQEAWEALEMEKAIGIELVAENVSILTQLHRVARERDQERKLRLETYVVCHEAMNQIGEERKKRIDAEEQLDDACSRYVRLAEYLQQKLSAEREKRLAAEDALLDKYMVDKTWEEMTKELHDTYLEELENEEE